MRKKYKNIIFVIVILGFLLTVWAVSPIFKPQLPKTFYLDPLSENEYIITYRVSSAIPAQNYDMVEYCINDNVYEFQGDALIVYTLESPSVTITYSNFARGDKATFYVPKGSVKRESGVGIR